MKIFSTIESWIRKWYLIEDRTFGTQRSPEWQKLRDNFIKVNNTCSACGTEKNLEAHHILPFMLYPEKELVLDNIITLCRDCHFFCGHLKNFRSWNLNVVEDSKIWLNKIKTRP